MKAGAKCPGQLASCKLYPSIAPSPSPSPSQRVRSSKPFARGPATAAPLHFPHETRRPHWLAYRNHRERYDDIVLVGTGTKSNARMMRFFQIPSPDHIFHQQLQNICFHRHSTKQSIARSPKSCRICQSGSKPSRSPLSLTIFAPHHRANATRTAKILHPKREERNRTRGGRIASCLLCLLCLLHLWAVWTVCGQSGPSDCC